MAWVERRPISSSSASSSACDDELLELPELLELSEPDEAASSSSSTSDIRGRLFYQVPQVSRALVLYSDGMVLS